MNNELYRSVIVPSRESPDGETPDVITVTAENNGYAIYRDCAEHGVRLIEWAHHDKNKLIEHAVMLAQDARAALAARGK